MNRKGFLKHDMTGYEGIDFEDRKKRKMLRELDLKADRHIKRWRKLHRDEDLRKCQKFRTEAFGIKLSLIEFK